MTDRRAELLALLEGSRPISDVQSQPNITHGSRRSQLLALLDGDGGYDAPAPQNEPQPQPTFYTIGDPSVSQETIEANAGELPRAARIARAIDIFGPVVSGTLRSFGDQQIERLPPVVKQAAKLNREVGGGLTGGVGGLTTAAAAPLRMIGADDSADVLSEVGEFLQDYGAPADDAGFVGRTVNNVSSAVPVLAGGVMAGVATAGAGPLTALGAFALSQAAPHAAQTFEESRRANMDAGASAHIAEARALREAGLVAGTSMLINSIPGAAILGRTAGPAFTSTARKVLNNATGRVAVSGLAEGGTEVAEELVGEYARGVYRQGYESFGEDFWKSLPETFVAGGTLGSAARVAVDRTGTAIDLTAKDPILSSVKKWGTAHGNIPRAAFESSLQRDQNVAASARSAVVNAKRLRKAIKAEYGDKVTDATLEKVNKVLHGIAAPDTLPDAVSKAVGAMRLDIDALSKRLRDSGATSDEMRGVIDGNLGVYVNRQYDIYNDPEWGGKVFEAIYGDKNGNMPDSVDPRIQKAASALYRWTKSEAERVGRKLALSNGDADIEARAREYANDILSVGGDGSDSLLSSLSNGTIRKNVSILKERSDIPEPIRMAWGEVTDPFRSYTDTVMKQSQLVHTHEMLDAIRNEGRGKWLFDDRPSDATPGDYKQFPKDSRGLEPLAGMWADSDVVDAMTSMNKHVQSNPLVQAYLQANAATKYVSTVGNAQTHVRNYLANYMFHVANGNWGLVGGKMLDAHKKVVADLGKFDAPETQAYLDRMYRLGVLGTEVRAGELRDVASDIDPDRGLAGFMEKRSGKMGKAVSKSGRKLVRGITDLYAAEDGVHKLFGFESYRSMLKKAFPDMDANALDAEAARRVQLTHPNYARVPQVVQYARFLPIAGPFMSFPSEVVRTQYNNVKLMAEDAQSGNPVLRRSAMRRAAGMTFAGVGTNAIIAGIRAMAGYTKEDEDDLREFMPPWSQQSQVVLLGKDSNGNPQYVDLSFTNPFAYIDKPARALLNGDDPVAAARQSVKAILEPFIEPQLLTRQIWDIAGNRDSSSGRQIRNPTDGAWKQAQDMSAHLGKAFVPGTVRSASRVARGVSGEPDRSGRLLDPGTEALAVISGHRLSNVDVLRSLEFAARDFNEQASNAKRGVGEVASARNEVRDRKMIEAVDEANFKLSGIYGTMHRKVQAAARLGHNSRQIATALKASGLSNRDIGILISGLGDNPDTYFPYVAGENFLAGAVLSNRGTDGSVVDADEARRRARLVNARSQWLYQDGGRPEARDGVLPSRPESAADEAIE